MLVFRRSPVGSSTRGRQKHRHPDSAVRARPLVGLTAPSVAAAFMGPPGAGLLSGSISPAGPVAQA